MSSNNKRNQSKTASGKWTVKENEAYERFVATHPDLFVKQASKGFKKFKQMAKVIRTRTSLQCRSHHQKMLIKATL